MANLTGIVNQLKQERDRVAKRLAGLNAAIVAVANTYRGANTDRQTRKLSPQARAKIAAAQRKRWAKVRAAKKKSA